MRAMLAVILLLPLVATPGGAAPVPDCPAIDVIEGRTLQCAVTPGLMTSTLTVPAGTDARAHFPGSMTGEWRITNEFGDTVTLFQFFTGGIVAVWTFGADEGDVWTSTITLTSGAGAVVVEWEI